LEAKTAGPLAGLKLQAITAMKDFETLFKLIRFYEIMRPTILLLLSILAVAKVFCQSEQFLSKPQT
jgi:hypothetical protein